MQKKYSPAFSKKSTKNGRFGSILSVYTLFKIGSDEYRKESILALYGRTKTFESVFCINPSMSLNGKVIVLADKYDINIASHIKYNTQANEVILVNRTDDFR